MGGIFNELTHYHMHVIPRYEGQSFAKFYSENEDNLTTATYDFNNELCKIKKTSKYYKNLSLIMTKVFFNNRIII